MPIARLALNRCTVCTNSAALWTVFQRYSDGVSKTINMPAAGNKPEIAAAFLLTYQLRCKGLTVYRTGAGNNNSFLAALTSLLNLAAQYAQFLNKIDTTRRW